MSNSINKSDFYYGAFLAKVIENENRPALINKNDGRGIYKLTTNRDEYIVYIKYRTRKNKNSKTWAFNYTENNIDEINKYIEEGENIIFAYICAYNDLKDSEIGIAFLDELKKCINPSCSINQSNRVTIRKKPGSPVLRMYGTNRADRKDNHDNTIHLERNRINEL